LILRIVLTLQTSPDLSLASWTTIATDIPIISAWTFTDTAVPATVTRRFYRAFLAPY